MNDTKGRRLVLVTGVPRSGTTVVGDILAAGKGVASVYEPMNIQSGDRRFDVPFPMPGAGGFSQGDLAEFLRDLRALRLNPRSGVFPHETGLAALGKWLVGSRTRASLRGARARPGVGTLVWKDPFAMLCVPDLLALGVPVVVTYRPALAIAASFKRLNWRFDIDAIDARVREAVNGPLPAPVRGGPDVAREVDCAVYLWRLCFAISVPLAGPRPVLISTGELNRAPLRSFEVIFAKLGLPLDDRARREIGQRFALPAGGAVVPVGHPHGRDRDFAQANHYWKHVLSPAEAAFVVGETGGTEVAFEEEIQRPVLVSGNGR